MLLLSLLFIAALQSDAQPAALDLSFNPGYAIGTNFVNSGYTIKALAVQSDQKILVGGTFGSFDSAANTQNLARLLPNGHVDTSFQHIFLFDYNVYAIAIQTDGKIVTGGGFWTAISGPKFITRLNTDGSQDTSFQIGTGFDGNVNALVIQPDGKILAGGGFTNYNGIPCGGIARLNEDGTYDTTFYATPGAVGGALQAIVLRPDNKIVIAGDFTNYDNDTLWRIALLNPDGSGVSQYNRFGGFDRAVFSLALMSDMSTIAAGYFTSWDFQTDYSKFAQTESNGTLHPAFNSSVPGPPPSSNSTIFSSLRLSDNRILMGGNFNHFGVAANCFAAIDSLAQYDTTFNVGTSFDGSVYAMAMQANGKILVGGPFNHYNGRVINSVARIYNCTTSKPGPISGDTLFNCPGAVLTYSIAHVPEASKYVWSLPAGWTGSSDSASITVTTGASSGIISVAAFSDSCGTSAPQTLAVQILQPASVPICEVTVDSQSRYNIIIWDKPQTNLIDSFFVYRQDTNFIFTKIASVPYAAFSEYNDTAAAADPNATAHQYKLSVIDNCGVESALSEYHSSIFLQNLGNGNFIWSPYEIENQPNPVTFYRVYRDTGGTGDFVPLNTIIPGGNNSYTDVQAALYPNADYVLDVSWNISCNPSRAVNTSRSNIKSGQKSLNGLSSLSSTQSFTLYPNPAHKNVIIKTFSQMPVTSVAIENLLGQNVYTYLNNNNLSFSTITVDVSTLPKGVYSVILYTGNNRVIKKFVLE